MFAVIAFAFSFALTEIYFVFRARLAGLLNEFYYERGWKFLGPLLSGSHDNFEKLYFALLMGFLIALGELLIDRSVQGGTKAFLVYSTLGILAGAFVYWWLSPDRVSPRFGGGGLFALDVMMSVAIVAGGFFATLFAAWILQKALS